MKSIPLYLFKILIHNELNITFRSGFWHIYIAKHIHNSEYMFCHSWMRVHGVWKSFHILCIKHRYMLCRCTYNIIITNLISFGWIQNIFLSVYITIYGENWCFNILNRTTSIQFNLIFIYSLSITEFNKLLSLPLSLTPPPQHNLVIYIFFEYLLSK